MAEQKNQKPASLIEGLNLYFSHFPFPIFLFLFSFFLFQNKSLAQKSQQGGYALVRVFDANKFVASGSFYVGSKIFITYEDGKQEAIELGAFSEKNEPENLKKITAVLNDMKKKGYLLMTATTTGDQGAIISDYVFLKQL